MVVSLSHPIAASSKQTLWGLIVIANYLAKQLRLITISLLLNYLISISYVLPHVSWLYMWYNTSCSSGNWLISLPALPVFLPVFSLVFLPSYILPHCSPKHFFLLSTNEKSIYSHVEKGYPTAYLFKIDFCMHFHYPHLFMKTVSWSQIPFILPEKILICLFPYSTLTTHIILYFSEGVFIDFFCYCTMEWKVNSGNFG